MVAARRCWAASCTGEASGPPRVAAPEPVTVDGETALLAAGLELNHKDPADRFIVAAAIKHRATLVTADALLLKWKHALKRQDAAK